VAEEGWETGKPNASTLLEVDAAALPAIPAELRGSKVNTDVRPVPGGAVTS